MRHPGYQLCNKCSRLGWMTASSRYCHQCTCCQRSCRSCSWCSWPRKLVSGKAGVKNSPFLLRIPGNFQRSSTDLRWTVGGWAVPITNWKNWGNSRGMIQGDRQTAQWPRCTISSAITRDTCRVPQLCRPRVPALQPLIPRCQMTAGSGYCYCCERCQRW